MANKKTNEWFIEKAINVYGNIYSFDKTNYNGIRSKIKIYCKEHGYFEKRADLFLDKEGCQKCARGILSTRLFIKLSIEKHGNLYKYDKVNYIDSKSLVVIYCEACKIYFEQQPSLHLNGYGCTPCGILKRTKAISGTLDSFLKISKNTHGDLYNYDNINFIDFHTEISIYCNKCKEYFKQVAGPHSRGSGCQKCGREKADNSRLLTKQEFIDECNKEHDNFYIYDETIYTGLNNKVTIFCPKENHGYFTQIASNHRVGHGCKKCANEQLRIDRTYSVDIFLEKAKIIHSNLYNYNNIQYVDTATRILITCNKCQNIFSQSPNAHLSGNGCKKCATDIWSKKRILSPESFLEQAISVHGLKYIYNMNTYSSASNYITIFCPINNHGNFEQQARLHLLGDVCRKCYPARASFGETQWLNSLNILPENRQYKIDIGNPRSIYVDGFDPKTNTVFEYLGSYWHGDPKIYKSTDINTSVDRTHGELYQKTLDRETKLKSLGYNVVMIWESDWNKQKEEQNDN